MATWKAKQEMEELKRRDPQAYERLVEARRRASASMGLFDTNLEEMRAEFGQGGAKPAGVSWYPELGLRRPAGWGGLPGPAR
jgi:hypothetical protein